MKNCRNQKINEMNIELKDLVLSIKEFIKRMKQENKSVTNLASLLSR